MSGPHLPLLLLMFLLRAQQALRLFAALLLIRFLLAKLHVPKRFLMALWIVYFVSLLVPYRIPVAINLPGADWLEISLQAGDGGVRRDGASILVNGADGPTSVFAGGFVAGQGGRAAAEGAGGAESGGAAAGGSGALSAAEEGERKTAPENAIHVWINPVSGESIYDGGENGTELLRAMAFLDPRTAWAFRHIARSAPVFWLWLAGATVLLLPALLQSLRLRKRLAESVPAVEAVPADGGEKVSSGKHRRFAGKSGGIFLSDQIRTPLVFGYFPPRIYLPAGLEERVRPYAIAHERTHIRRWHPWGKLAAYLITCLHWTNPLAWLGFHLMSADMEMVCDEETVRRLGEEERARYAEALLAISLGEGVRRHIFAASPLTFEEGDAKRRLKNLADWKRTAPAALVLAGLFVAVLAAAAFTRRSDESYAQHTDSASERGIAPGEDGEILRAASGEPPLTRDSAADAGDGSDETANLFEDGKLIAGTFAGEFSDDLPAEMITAEPVDANIARYQYVLAAYPGSWYAFASVPLSAAAPPDAADAGKNGTGAAQEAADTVLLRAENVYEDGGERRAVICEVYRRIGSTFVRAGEIRADGTAYPIRADAGGLYVTGPHFAARYTLSGTTIDTAEDVSETFDQNGAATYTYSCWESDQRGDGAEWAESKITEAEYNDLVRTWEERAPAVAFLPIPLTTTHDYAAWSEEIGAKADEETGDPDAAEREGTANRAENAASLRTLEDVLAAYAERILEQQDYRAMEGANVERIVPGGTTNYYASLPLLSESGVRYELQASYGIADDALENLYLRRPSDGDNLWLWRSPDTAWRISVEGQDATGYISDQALQAFLAREKFDLNEHVKLDLPTGYEIGSYQADLGWGGGALILPQTYFPSEEGYAPEEWQYAGFVGQMRADFVQAQGQEAEGAFAFTNGLPSTTGLPMHNHTERSEVTLVFREGGFSSVTPYLYYTESRDLYTGAGAAAYEERTGEALTEEALTSDYHVFVFPVEGAENWFYLELDARTFSEEEAKAIAESAVYTPW